MSLTSQISKSFSQQAPLYEQAAVVQQEIGERLFERLSYLKMDPRWVLDLGCGTGLFSQRLKKTYPKATIVGLDLAYAMLLEARKKQRLWSKWPLLTADMAHLPFADGLFDLVFTNQVIHWSNDLPLVLQELNRVMRPGACLMFSSLGPDTFRELRQAWVEADQFVHTNQFKDMHELGDALMAECFLDPVVDMQGLTVHYSSLLKLVRALKEQGVRNINPARNPGLTSPTVWRAFEHAYQKLVLDGGKYPLSYEVIYGQAWKGEQRRVGGTIETQIPITNIKRESGYGICK